MTLKQLLEAVWNNNSSIKYANHLCGWSYYNGALRPQVGAKVKEPTDKAAAKRLKKARQAFSKYKGEI